MTRLARLVAAGLLVAAATSAQAPVPEPTVVDRVADLLSRYFYDPAVRERVPGLAAKFRERLQAGDDERRQREVAFELLREIDVSHLGLLSKSSHERLFDELWRRPRPTLGFELLKVEGDYYVVNVLEGGPADRSGLREGVRVRSIDGVVPERSSRLDFRTDDAALPDPPQHYLLAADGECVEVELDAPPETSDLSICAAAYSAFEAFRHSASTLEVGGVSVAYAHLWFVHMTGVVETLRDLLETRFADAEVFVFDLRGRGGSAPVVERILELFGEGAVWNKPVVAVVDRRSRSAKDVLAYELRERDLARLVGERTAGAVIPAMFAMVGDDTVLMYPARSLGRYTDLLEGVGVEPHVAVAETEIPALGDPILDRAFEVAVEWVAALASDEQDDAGE